MKKVMKTFLVLSLLGFFACNKKSGDLVLASSAGVQVNSSVIEKILQDLPEQSKSELENSKQAMEDFVMNTATQLASIDIIAKKAKEAGVEDGQDYKTRLSLGEQELLIRIFVAQKFTAKEEDLSDEQLRAEYDKIKATRSKEELKNFPEFEAVKARIKQQLVSQKAQEQFQAFVAPLTAKVEIDQANVAKVADDFYKGKDLDDKVVISKVGDASITVGDLLLSLGDISLEDVRKQVKSKQEAEQFFAKSAENLGVNVQIEQIAKDEGVEKSEQFAAELKEIEKILLVNIYLQDELFADLQVDDAQVKAEYEKIKASNKDLGPLSEVADRIKAQLLAVEQERLVMGYLETLKAEIELNRAAIDDFVYQNLSKDAKDAWDDEKGDEASEK